MERDYFAVKDWQLTRLAIRKRGLKKLKKNRDIIKTKIINNKSPSKLRLLKRKKWDIEVNINHYKKVIDELEQEVKRITRKIKGKK